MGMILIRDADKRDAALDAIQAVLPITPPWSATPTDVEYVDETDAVWIAPGNGDPRWTADVWQAAGIDDADVVFYDGLPSGEFTCGGHTFTQKPYEELGGEWVEADEGVE